jgi:ATP-dependent protease HslVU (ClpYQ) peptidase subunit
MSVVVAYANKNECSMSFDSGAFGEGMIFKVKTPKAIKHVGNGLIGVAGSWRVINLVASLKSQNCTPQNIVDLLKSITNEDTSMSDMEILCAWPGKPLVIIQNDFSVLQLDSPFMAVGSGSPYALGYLEGCKELNKGALTGAVEAAIKYSASVSGQVKNLYCAAKERL